MIHRRICYTSIAAFVSLLAVGRADTFTWDPLNDSGAIAAGGTWNITTPNWLGAPGRIWPNEVGANADIALFGGTGLAPFVVNLGAPITANGLTFDLAGYTIADGGIGTNVLTLDGTTPTITANADAAISAGIAGTVGFTKAGNGVLTLSGANTYSGVTSITAGVLSIGASNHLGGAAAGNSLSINGGSLRTTNTVAVDLGVNRALAIGASDATLDAQGTATVTISGALSGALGNNLTKIGSGTVLITGPVNANNGFLGDITVNAGTLQFGGVAGTQYNGVTGGNNAARTITVNAGGTLDLIGRDMIGASVAVTVNGGLIKNAGFNQLGVLTLNGATIQVVSGQAPTFQALTFESDVFVQGTTPSQITGSAINNGGIHLQKIGGPVINVPDVTGDANADFTIAPALIDRTNNTGANGFTKTGNGTLVLTGANGFTGTMTVSTGIVRLTSTLADTADVDVAAGATVELNTATDTFDQITGTGSITRTAAGTGTFTVFNGGGSSAFGGVISDGAGVIAITKGGAGTGTFNGTNTYTGTTFINNGVIAVNGSAGALAGSAILTVGDNNGGGETLTVGAVGDVWSGGVLNRLADTAALTINGTSTGGFLYTGPATGSTGNAETMGSITISSGRNNVTLTPGTDNEVQLAASTLARANSGTALIRGDNLGGTGVGSTRLVISTNVPLFGGGGADGTTTKSIVPFAVGDNLSTGGGSGFLTHDATNGLRLLTAAEYDSSVAGALVLRNVSAAGGETLTGEARLNGLRLTGTGTTTLGTDARVSLASGAMLFTGDATIDGVGFVDFGASEGVVTVAGNAVTNATINARLAGAAGVSFSSTGSGANVITVGGDNTLIGTAFVNSGTVRLGNAGALNDNYPMTVLLRTATTLQINGNNVTVRDLQGTTGTGTIQNGAATPATLTTYLTGARTFTPALANGAAGALNLVVSGAQTLTLNGANTYTGTTEIRTGQITLSGNNTGHIASSSGITIAGGTLNLRNQNGNVLTNRVNDNGTITMLGGTFTFDHNADSGTSFAETDAGALVLSAGANVVNIDKANTGRTSAVTFDSLARNAGATVNFTSALGDGAAVFDLGVSTLSRLVVTAAPVLDDGIIGGWATTDSSASTREFAKYVTGANASVTALVAADYTTTLSSGVNPTQNVKITATPAFLVSPSTVNSLNLAQASATTLELNTNALRIDSGGVIVSGNFNANIINGTLTAGSGLAGELIFHTLGAAANPVTVDAIITDNGLTVVSLVKAGAGVLDLQGVINTFTGRATVNGGVLRIDGDRNLGAIPGAPSAGHLTLSNGGTLEVAQNMTLNANRGLTVGVGTNIVSIASGTAGNGKVLTYNGAITGIAEGSLTFQSNASTTNTDTGEINANLSAPISLGGTLRIEAGTVTAAAGNNVIGRSFQLGLNGTASYTQSSGTLRIGAGINDTFDVGVSGSETVNKVGTLNLAGATNLTVNVDQVRIGVVVSGNSAAQGTVTFATNNDITAGTSILVGDSLSPGLALQTLNFGSGINNVTTQSFVLGARKAAAILNVAAGGTLNLNGFGQRTLDMTIGRQNVGTAGLNSSTLNATDGTVNASFDELIIGLKSSGPAGNHGGSDSVVSLGTAAHRIEASTVRLGDMAGASTGLVAESRAFGTINMAGGSFTTFNNVVLGAIDPNQGTSKGVINLTGGTFVVGGDITKLANDRSGGVITLDGTGAVLDLRNDAGGDSTNGTMTLSQLVFRRGTIQDVASATLDGRGVTNGITFAALDDALIARDVTVNFPVNLTNATANKGGIHYEAAGGGSGAVISGNVDLGTVDRTFNVENSVSAAADLAVSGSITGNVLLTKTGIGTLLLNGSVAGSVTATAGTLGGFGTIDGPVTIGAGVALAPGASAGTLTTGDLILNPTSSSRFELTTGDVTLGGGINDLVIVNGGLTLDGTLFVSEIGGLLNNDHKYVLFDYSGTLTDNGLSLDGTFLANHPLAAIEIDTTNTQVLLSVPEPSAPIALLMGIGSLLGFQRRRRKA